MEIKPVKIFLSYSHKDERLKNQLEMHLTPLKSNNKIALWHDRLILAGEDWDKNINKHIDTSDIILLLVSPNFNASNYIYSIELKKALDLNASGHVKVVPIFLKSCDFSEMPYAKLQGLPRDAKFVTAFVNKDDAFTVIVKELKKLIDDLYNKKNSPPVELKKYSNLKDELNDLISDGLIKECLDEISKIHGKNEAIIMFKSMYSNLKNRDRLGTISYPDFEVEINKISNRIIEFINENYK